MNRTQSSPSAISTSLLTVSVLGVWCFSCYATDFPPPERWEKTIQKFEAEDEKTPPPKNAILFVGSSSIRLWDLKKSFPDRVTINRGFGGSDVSDSLHFADRIVLKHKPRVIIMYAGDNDISRGKSPERVHQDFLAFVKKVHEKQPKTQIHFLAIKPSGKRWALVDTIRKANSLVKAECEKNKLLFYIDIFEPMLGDDGKPRGELFVEDQLHLNEKGYQLWNQLVRASLKAANE